MSNSTIETGYSERRAIATTILSQFAGGRPASHFVVMTGTKDIIALESGVRFTLKPCEFNTSGINRVEVILTGRDDYNVKFSRVWGNKEKVIATHEGVFCDDLPDLFAEATKLIPYMGY